MSKFNLYFLSSYTLEELNDFISGGQLDIHKKYPCDPDCLSIIMSLLQVAIQKKCSIEIIEFLLLKGSNINYQTNTGYTAVHYAVLFWDSENIIELLLNYGADVNIKNNNHDMPLHLATMYNRNITIIKLLLGPLGLNVNAINNAQKTPFYYALRNDNIEIIKLMIQKGTNVNGFNLQCTPLYYLLTLSSWKKINMEIVQLLIQNGAHLGHDLHINSINKNKKLYKRVLFMIKEKTVFDLWILE